MNYPTSAIKTPDLHATPIPPGVSYEFRTSLNTILMSVEILEEDVLAENLEDILLYIQNIKAAGERMRSLLEGDSELAFLQTRNRLTRRRNTPSELSQRDLA
jgi:signal transduction histidine kinase